MLSASAENTGRPKNTPITSNEGPAKIQPASERCFMAAPPARRLLRSACAAHASSGAWPVPCPRGHPVDSRLHLVQPTAHHLFGDDAHFLHDPFPTPAPSGSAARARAGRGTVAPWGRWPATVFLCQPRRQVTDDGMEALLDIRARQELDQLPRRFLLLRTAEDHRAGAAGDAGAGAIRARQCGSAPLAFQFLGLELLELADVRGRTGRTR